MKYNIVSDSCLDYNDQLFNKDFEINRIPFKININGTEHIDINNKITSLLGDLNFKAKSITTACPSPLEFYESFKEKTDNFIITISSRLSGSHQSAIMAKKMIQEELGEKINIHIFDSKSAAAGQDMIALKIKELLDMGESFQSVIDKTSDYINKMKTIFSLESLDTLVSNGRVAVAKQYLTKAFNLFPILYADDGKIEMLTFARGKDNAVNKLIASIGTHGKDFSDRVIGITHINALDKANYVKEQVAELYNFKDIHIFEGGGLSSVYASNRGIVLAF